MCTYRSGSVATKQGSVVRRENFASIWSKLSIIQTIEKAFFVRNPAVLMNGKIISTQLTFKTTVLADKLTFEKSVIAKSKLWTYFVKTVHGFVYKSMSKSVLTRVFVVFPSRESGYFALWFEKSIYIRTVKTAIYFQLRLH